MSDPVSRLTVRAVYGLTQLPRIAWYVGQGAAMRRLSRAVRRREGEPRAHPVAAAAGPGRGRLLADMAALLRRDLANVEAGLYPPPRDHDGTLRDLLHQSELFFTDLPAVHRRRQAERRTEVLTDDTRGKRPLYYLQNFHFQSGGWLTEESARRYDTQVEVLFRGMANATRRQAIPPLAEIFAGRDQRRLKLLDIGCGTGRFLDFVKQAWPRLPCVGLDMSEAYAREAKRHLRRWARINLLVGNGEQIPAPDASFDAVASLFVFHELPPKVRHAVMSECTRVLKPGGRFVLLDSLQLGDAPVYDGVLHAFPHNFHEPYYASYINEDFTALAQSCGLARVGANNAFVSKVMVFDKPAAPAAARG